MHPNYKAENVHHYRLY